MTPQSVRSALALRINERVFYGWVVLAVSAIGMFASGPGQSHTFSVFIGPIAEDLALSRTEVSSAYAFATLAAAFGLPYVGRLIDRFGARRVVLTVSVLLGFAALAFGHVAGLVSLALGFAALRFLGQGSLMLNCSNLVSQWFSRRRGFALSLMALGFSTSIAVHPTLAQWLIEQVGWREAWLWLGVLTWILLLPLIVVFVQNKPEDMGLVPDGREAPAGEPGRADHRADVGLTLREALRTPAFWIIAVSLASLSMLVTGLFFYQVQIFESHELHPALAARMFAVSAVVMVVSMPLLGQMLDRFPTRRMFAGALLTMTAALLAMLAARDVGSALAYAVVFGINNAALHTHYTYLWPRFFGRRHLGSIQGTAQTVGVVGASLGPLPFGIAYDVTGSFTPALAGLAALPLVCAVAVLFFLEPPRLAPAD